MPANVRKAEIDIRDGSLIRELDQTETASNIDIKKDAERKNGPTNADPTQQADTAELTPQPDVISVPPEFRRVELFVGGTVPVQKIAPVEEPQFDPETGEPIEKTTPTPKPTPVNGTWQDGDEPPEPDGSPGNSNRTQSSMITVTICPLTGMRATINCPEHERRTFRRGTEPKEFCTFHVNPPR